jgi:hypothetical protein
VLLGDLSVCGTRSDLPRNRIDQEINGLWKGGATLNVMIAYETKGSALRKDCSVVVYRPIAEMENES